MTKLISIVKNGRRIDMPVEEFKKIVDSHGGFEKEDKVEKENKKEIKK